MPGAPSGNSLSEMIATGAWPVPASRQTAIMFTEMAQKQKASKLYRGADPRLAPTYSFAEAAHYLRLPVETLRYWSLGRGGTCVGLWATSGSTSM